MPIRAVICNPKWRILKTLIFYYWGSSGLSVVINDKRYDVGKQGNFCMFVSKRPEPMLDITCEGNKLQSKMAAIENVNFSYNFI